MKRLSWLCGLIAVACVKSPPVGTSTPADDDTSTHPPPVFEACESWSDPEPVGRVQDSTLQEISGLVVSEKNEGVLWVLEDSGARAELVALDTSGQTLGVVTLKDVVNTDWEDLALGPCGDTTCLWVGEFGDNAWAREEVAILRVEEPVIADKGRFDLELEPVVQRYTYPEGPQDVEALMITPEGEPLVMTKRTDATARIYRVPMTGDNGVMAELLTTVSTGPVDGLPTAVTATDMWPDGSRILVRCYLYTFEILLGELAVTQASEAPTRTINPHLKGREKPLRTMSQTRRFGMSVKGFSPSFTA